MPVDKFYMGHSTGCGATTASWGSPVGLVHRAGDTMLGNLSLGGFQLKDVGNPLDSSDAATKEYVDALVISSTDLLDTKVDLLPVDLVHRAGDTMLGDLSLGGNEITGLADPKTDQSAASKKYVDTLVISTMALLDAKVLQLDGSKAPTHDIRWGNHRISELADPKAPQDAATKAYVDELARALGPHFDIFEISLQWGVSRSLSLTPLGLPQLTQNPRNEGDRRAFLAISAPGVYKIQLTGLRTGTNREPIDISVHMSHPLTLVVQHTITNYVYFNTSGVCVISEPALLQLALTSVRTATNNNINIGAKLLLEKL